jgi:hypothetical protein
MAKRIIPKTSDPEAMMREGWHEPERVFTAPPLSVIEGPIEERAYEILELIVGIYRVSTHESITRQGVSWANVQRWYALHDFSYKGGRVYAAIAYLVASGYLREGPPGVMTPPGLTSDYYIPTAKGYACVTERHEGWLHRAWALIEGHRLGAVAASAVVVIAVGAIAGRIAGFF